MKIIRGACRGLRALEGVVSSQFEQKIMGVLSSNTRNLRYRDDHAQSFGTSGGPLTGLIIDDLQKAGLRWLRAVKDA